MKKILFISIIIWGTFLYADDLNELLDVYAQNSDLSEKTKSENSGILTIFSRKDLEISQARNLKDILKSIPTVGYNESRYGFVDSLYTGSASPFNSGRIRVFIDEYEVTSGIYSSGLAVLGDIDIGFVDHIEVYTHSPSFEYSSEPAYVLIKLYSKEAERDVGGKVELSYGSRNYNQESLFYAQETKNFSYFTYLSRLDDRRKIYGTKENPLNRNLERYHLFASLYTTEHKLQLTAIKGRKNTFIGLSQDATPSISYMQYGYLFLGYSYHYENKLKLNISAEKTKHHSHMQDSSEYK